MSYDYKQTWSYRCGKCNEILITFPFHQQIHGDVKFRLPCQCGANNLINFGIPDDIYAKLEISTTAEVK